MADETDPNTECRPTQQTCPFCLAEVIERHEYGKEGPQGYVCCRLIPLCGAEFTLSMAYIAGSCRRGLIGGA